MNPCPLEIWIDGIFANFPFSGHSPTKKNFKIEGCQTSTLTSLQPRGRIAERSLTPYCSARARKFPASCQFFLWRAVSVLRDVKFPQFSHFCLFFPCLKRTFRWQAYSSVPFHYNMEQPEVFCNVIPEQLRDYIAEYFRLFHIVVEGKKAWLLLVGFCCDLWRGNWGPQNCPNFRRWVMPVCTV